MNYRIVGACKNQYKYTKELQYDRNQYDKFIYEQPIPNTTWTIRSMVCDCADIVTVLVITNDSIVNVPFELIDSITVKLEFPEPVFGNAVFIYRKSLN